MAELTDGFGLVVVVALAWVGISIPLALAVGPRLRRLDTAWNRQRSSRG